jgi:hypothetical protein
MVLWSDSRTLRFLQAGQWLWNPNASEGAKFRGEALAATFPGESSCDSV